MSAATDREDLLRELAPQVLGAMMRRFGDFATAEDAVQEALLAASQHWPVEGLPGNPRAWLIQAAVRRVTDQMRSESARRRREDVAAQIETVSGPGSEEDDSLALLLMCCHPSLTETSAIALTLRAVGGLTTAEIASAFFVPEATMAQRISRAKQRIKASNIPFQSPAADELSARLPSVLRVLYLIFNEGYASSGGATLLRTELSAEAIRLTRGVYRSLPRQGEVGGLLALMLLTDARRPARSGPGGEIIPLAEQDRSLWRRPLIAEGMRLVVEAMSYGTLGEYLLQAAIAGVHDEALRAEDTEWPKILALYGMLERIAPNPMVTLNRAVAVAMVQGPAAGLEILEPLEASLGGHHRLAAVRAHFHELAGEPAMAVEQYDQAAKLTTSLPERYYLTMRAARLRSRGGSNG